MVGVPTVGAAGAAVTPVTTVASGLGSDSPLAVMSVYAYLYVPAPSSVPDARANVGAVLGDCPGPTSDPPPPNCTPAYVTICPCAPSGVVLAIAWPPVGVNITASA